MFLPPDLFSDVTSPNGSRHYNYPWIIVAGMRQIMIWIKIISEQSTAMDDYAKDGGSRMSDFCVVFTVILSALQLQ